MFIKEVIVGNIGVGLYFEDETNAYVVTEFVVTDDEELREELLESLNGEYVTKKYNKAIEELQARICDRLNDYFDEEETLVN